MSTEVTEENNEPEVCDECGETIDECICDDIESVLDD